MYSRSGEELGTPAVRGPDAGILAGGLSLRLAEAIKQELNERLSPREPFRIAATAQEFQNAIRARHVAVAIVPLEWATDMFLDEARGNGETVTLVCFADHCDRLPISEYCRAFSSGISYLLDSATPGFVASLGQIVTSLLGQEYACPREANNWTRVFQDLGVVGAGANMVRIFEQAGRAALASDVPALLLGESGTGKQVFAEALHRLDPKRRSRPFIAVNCSTITHALAESELFGHQKGSFTGASETRKGCFRTCDGGTLFLDEIGELDLRLQPKLLRVLEQKTVVPVGGDREIPVDVRVVSATSRDLPAMVQAGTFRLDLFERLNVVVVRIPALRERPNDIEPLILHLAARHGWKLAGVDRRVIDALVATKLPGNVRELENIVRRSIVAAHNKTYRTFRVADLPADVLRAVASMAAEPMDVVLSENGLPKLPLEKLLDAKLSYAEALALCSEALITEALRRTNGRRSAAARLLRVSERTIFNKIRFDKIRRLGPKQELTAGDRNHHLVRGQGIGKANNLGIGQAV